MAQAKYNLGVIGCGHICQTYLSAIQQVDSLNLSAVFDVNSKLAATVAEQAQCPAFDNLEEFIECGEADGVIICTPPATHQQLVCTLLEAGKHVLCEKPFALNTKEAEKMFATAKQQNKTLMMASKFRYLEDLVHAKAFISSGTLGDVHFYNNYFGSKCDMSKRWNVKPELSGGGVLIDNGTHSVDIVRYLFGPIAKVYVHESNRPKNWQVEDSVTLMFVTEQGFMGNISLSWRIPVDRKSFVEIYGSEGAIQINWEQSRYQSSTNHRWTDFGNGYNKVKTFANQLINFTDCAAGLTQPLITEEDVMASVKVIEAAYKSMQQKSWVDVEK